jgi:diacylglycerol kinase (ATP)
VTGVAPVGRLLANPHAARGRARRTVDGLARASGLEARHAASPAEMEAEARRAAEDGLDRVLVAGGDGTIHHAIRGLAGTPCALGIVPLGTGNDLARALGVPRGPLAAARSALAATPRPIDVGRIDGLPFAGVAGIGIDAEVNRRVERLRWLGGRLAYAVATLGALATFSPPHVEVDFDGGALDGPVLLLALANSPCFGGGMRIAPRARLDDGQLDLVLVRPVPLRTLARVFPRVYSGTHLDHAAVRTARVSSARVRSTPEAPVYADGEPVTRTSERGLTIDVWPAALRVVV